MKRVVRVLQKLLESFSSYRKLLNVCGKTAGEFMGRVAPIILLLLVVGGCIFEPREPEQPGGGEETNWIVPLTANDVFLNLTSGFSAAGNSNYERSLHEEFTFKPRPEDEAAIGGDAFENWDKSVEMEFLTRLKGEYPVKRSIRFGDENGHLKKVKEQAGLVEFEGEYRIEISAGADVEVYAGKARFIMVETSLGWMLKEWEDYDIVGSYPTSGILRGRLRGG